MSAPGVSGAATARSGLAREMGLLGLTATGICAMVGAAVNVIPFMIQRQVPGIGPNVLPAYLLGAVPAMLAGLAYAMLASAMPRAGGSYVFASRALSPYLGFVASFSQWFSLSVVMGVVSFLITPFLRDIAVALQWPGVAATLEHGAVRMAIALGVLWAATGLNLLGIKAYERLMVPLMFLTFALGSVVIVAGFSYDHVDFLQALSARGDSPVVSGTAAPLSLTLLPGSVLLFASFIGFDSIAQAGGEARRPSRDLPLALPVLGEPATGFAYAGEWQATPPRVRVIGPEGVLSQLDTLRLAPLRIDGRRDSVVMEVGPERLPEWCRAEPLMVRAVVRLPRAAL